MKCDKASMLLYGVTDRAWVEEYSLIQQVEMALKGGVTCIQLREKNLEKKAFLEEAKSLSKLCHAYRVPFFINDDVKIALQCGADGIHVGQEDMSATQVRKLVGDKMMIGVSVHTVEEAKEAVKNGADCLGVGAMFDTSTKKDAEIVSLHQLKAICQAVDIPVVAIGGINKENILELSGTGVDGAALVSAIFGSKNIERECLELKALSEKMVHL